MELVERSDGIVRVGVGETFGGVFIGLWSPASGA